MILRPGHGRVNLTEDPVKFLPQWHSRLSDGSAIFAQKAFIILTPALHFCFIHSVQASPSWAIFRIMSIHIVAIAWMFVVVLMAAAEGMAGSIAGAFGTLLLYGIAPLSIVLYVISTPARRKSHARKEALLREAAQAARETDPPA